jgi:hypothetical protein
MEQRLQPNRPSQRVATVVAGEFNVQGYSKVMTVLLSTYGKRLIAGSRVMNSAFRQTPDLSFRGDGDYGTDYVVPTRSFTGSNSLCP